MNDKIMSVVFCQTWEHYLPLIYTLGATKGETPIVFNNVFNLRSMAMTGFVFKL
jgi:4,5-DOPA dioxygenase extradiol